MRCMTLNWFGVFKPRKTLLPTHLRFNVLIHRISDCLSRPDAHDSGNNALVKRPAAFALEKFSRKSYGVN